MYRIDKQQGNTANTSKVQQRKYSHYHIVILIEYSLQKY